MAYTPYKQVSPVYFVTATGAVIMHTKGRSSNTAKWRCYYSKSRALWLGTLAGDPRVGDLTPWGEITQRVVPEPPEWAAQQALACYREYGPGLEPRDTYWNSVLGPAANAGSKLNEHIVPVQLYRLLQGRGLAVSTRQPYYTC